MLRYIQKIVWCVESWRDTVRWRNVTVPYFYHNHESGMFTYVKSGNFCTFLQFFVQDPLVILLKWLLYTMTLNFPIHSSMWESVYEIVYYFQIQVLTCHKAVFPSCRRRHESYILFADQVRGRAVTFSGLKKRAVPNF